MTLAKIADAFAQFQLELEAEGIQLGCVGFSQEDMNKLIEKGRTSEFFIAGVQPSGAFQPTILGIPIVEVKP